MKQPYFIIVLAHSIHGRLRRIHVPYSVVYGILALALLGCFTLFGLVSSYARMAWKVANYNNLRDEVSSLRVRYHELQRSSDQAKDQMATLQALASEVSIAYGITRKLEGPANISAEGRLTPSFPETLEEYNLLKSAGYSRSFRKYAHRFHTDVIPSLWPIAGRLHSAFGNRTDPLRGGDAFHTGVDISAPVGTPVRVAADGVVTMAEWFSNYGRTVIVDHGNGLQTYYAHLAGFNVIEGQEVRKGQIIAYSGASGRVTSPHLHYEVRRGSAPINPYKYLAKSLVAQSKPKDLPF